MGKRTVSIRDLRTRGGDVVALAAAGEPVTITRDGRPWGARQRDVQLAESSFDPVPFDAAAARAFGQVAASLRVPAASVPRGATTR